MENWKLWWEKILPFFTDRNPNPTLQHKPYGDKWWELCAQIFRGVSKFFDSNFSLKTCQIFILHIAQFFGQNLKHFIKHKSLISEHALHRRWWLEYIFFRQTLTLITFLILPHNLFGKLGYYISSCQKTIKYQFT